MKVITTITLRLGKGAKSTYAEPGTEIDLPDDEAQELLDRGHVKVAGEAKENVAQPTLEDIAEVIDQLDSQKDFKDGLPILKSIERILKSPVTTAQRDEAWAKVEADRKAAAK